MLGLERGRVELVPHDPMWHTEAERIKTQLRSVFGDTVCEIEHIGSTAIDGIMAKPILDFVLSATDFATLLSKKDEFFAQGVEYRKEEDGGLLFIMGSGNIRTAHLHIVKAGSAEWRNYLLFRDYLNEVPEAAKIYEAKKTALWKRYPADRAAYTAGKAELIAYILRKATVWYYLGKTVHIGIDRPIGYVHHKKNYTLTYPINYGYIPGVAGGDGEDLDVYLLGVDHPVTEADCRIIAVLHRENDVEDKLVGAPEGREYSEEEIFQNVRFQEQYYRTRVEILRENANPFRYFQKRD